MLAAFDLVESDRLFDFPSGVIGAEGSGEGTRRTVSGQPRCKGGRKILIFIRMTVEVDGGGG